MATGDNRVKGELGELSQGGFPREILGQNVDDKFVCNYCSKILKDPVQSFCGHRFCRACIEGVAQKGSENRCKQCENEGVTDDYSLLNENQMFPDNAVKREMSSLNVQCINPSCNWHGKFRGYEDHASVCQFRLVTCPTCGKTNIPQSQLASHMKECQPSVVCPAGCGEMDMTTNIRHLEAKAGEHLTWLMNRFQALAQQFEKSSQEQQKTTSDFTNRVTALERQVVDVINNGLVGNRTQMAEAIQAATGPISSKCQQLEVKTNTFEGICTVLHKEIEKLIQNMERFEHNRRAMTDKIDALEHKNRTLERTLAVKEITLAEQDLRLQSLESASYDGVLVWKITEFSQKKAEAMRGQSISIYSPAFYTGRRGYKMCARVYPNGDGMGKGSHLSLFFVLMKGNFDAILSWPFKQRVTFCLINQQGGDHIMDSFRPDQTSSSFKRPTSDMNIASGCPLFVRLDDLTNPKNGYMKDDTMFIKVIIDTADIVELHASARA